MSDVTSGKAPTPYSCDECEWTGSADELDSIVDVEQRVAMGEFMAAGCCPECGSLVSVADADVPSHTLEDAEQILFKRGKGQAVALANALNDLLGSSVNEGGYVVLKPSPSSFRAAAMALAAFRMFMAGVKPKAVLPKEALVPEDLASSISTYFQQQIDDGNTSAEDIPRLVTQYGLMSPQAFVDEMKERIGESD